MTNPPTNVQVNNARKDVDPGKRLLMKAEKLLDGTKGNSDKAFKDVLVAKDEVTAAVSRGVLGWKKTQGCNG